MTSSLTSPNDNMAKSISINKTSVVSALTFVMLVIITQVLSFINLPTIYGFKIHLFQVAVFSGAIIFGPITGGLIGGLGSIYSGLLMHNPYLVVGNIILGFFMGLFIKKGIHPVVSALLAFAIQLPWLIATDKYLMHMPNLVLKSLVIALLITNTMWALIVSLYYKKLPRFNGA